jgi:hypothetical protein
MNSGNILANNVVVVYDPEDDDYIDDRSFDSDDSLDEYSPIDNNLQCFVMPNDVFLCNEINLNKYNIYHNDDFGVGFLVCHKKKKKSYHYEIFLLEIAYTIAEMDFSGEIDDLVKRHGWSKLLGFPKYKCKIYEDRIVLKKRIHHHK